MHNATTTRRDVTLYEEDVAMFDQCLRVACERAERRNYGRAKSDREWLFDTRAERGRFEHSE